MSVNGVSAVGFTPAVPPVATPNLDAATGTTGTSAVAPAGGEEFGKLVIDGVDRLQQVQAHSDQLAVRAATGDLTALHQYTIAASEAAVTTQLTVAVRNKAIEAFNEIMRMPV